ncbi:hypothetical protein BB561_004172 [Smittium simulii]|uniref:Glutamyl-tRNA(Gln) amidotransferase subunit A, mitochondrial n=1 Tax=Smittium simulii TaxID=133385 RepID=A0A2T9YHN3_9FUNG|nr:hypothetical protein BB561_004172 [Smittium simulii]
MESPSALVLGEQRSAELRKEQQLGNDLAISILVPPLNFAMVAPGIYRSGFPNTKNHKFLLSLGLKKIIYIYNGDCLEYHKKFCLENEILLLHYRLESNKEPFQEMNQEAVAKIIVEILDTRNQPILVHCNRGVRRVGCIVGCLRRMQGWAMTAIFEEFQRFSGNRIRIPDQEPIVSLRSHYSSYAKVFLSEYSPEKSNYNPEKFNAFILDLLEQISYKDKSTKAVLSLSNSTEIINEYTQNYNKANLESPTGLAGSTREKLDNLGLLLFCKDNYNIFNTETTCSSRALQNFFSPYTATAVELLKFSGAVILGKTNMDEFAMGSTNTTSFFGSSINPFTTSVGREVLKLLSLPLPTENLYPSNKENQTSTHFSTNNYLSSEPLDTESRLCGGSSGGSAVAVASRFCNAALGSDTGGSVRLPASWCGVVGFKPSYGRFSRYGLIDYANSFDTVGILAENVFTATKVYKTLDKYDSRDMTSLNIKHRQDLQNLISDRNKKISDSLSNSGSLNGLRIGIPKEYYISELTDPVLEAWKSLAKLCEEMGAIVEPISLPHTKYALSAYYTLTTAEASSNLAKFDGVRYGYKHVSECKVNQNNDTLEIDGIREKVIESDTSAVFSTTRSAGFGTEVQSRILLGNYVLSLEAFKEHYEQAQKIRTLIVQDFNCVFGLSNYLFPETDINNNRKQEKFDLILVPTSTNTAPLANINTKSDELADKKLKGTESYLNDVMTVPMSLAGLPAISIPVGVSRIDGLAIGLQLVGQFGDDELVLNVAKSLESALNKQSQGKSEQLNQIIPLVPKIAY